jgi:hypothetical protein
MNTILLNNFLLEILKTLELEWGGGIRKNPPRFIVKADESPILAQEFFIS